MAISPRFEEHRRLPWVEGPRPALTARLLGRQTAVTLQVGVTVGNRPPKPAGKGATDGRFAGTHQPHENDVASRGRCVGIHWVNVLAIAIRPDRAAGRPNHGRACLQPGNSELHAKFDGLP